MFPCDDHIYVKRMEIPILKVSFLFQKRDFIMLF